MGDGPPKCADGVAHFHVLRCEVYEPPLLLRTWDPLATVPRIFFTMGVGALATLLVADEVEHYRCGIGCVLERNHSTGGFYVSKIVRGGTAENSALQEQDEILRINEHVVANGMTVDDISTFIRGKEGSIVTIVVRKPTGQVVTVRLVRTRLPGAKTEMLGALWQQSGQKIPKNITLNDKLDVLGQLYRRGNLSEKEYELARRRLLEGDQAIEGRKDENSDEHMSALIRNLSTEWEMLTASPKHGPKDLNAEGSPVSRNSSNTPNSLHNVITF